MVARDDCASVGLARRRRSTPVLYPTRERSCIPMSDPATTTDQAPAAPPTDQAPAPEKTFTQSELDAIIAERVKRAEAKYKDHADLKAKAAKLDQIEAANASDLDKAVAKATADTRAAVAREIGVKAARGVVAARLEAGGRKPADVAAIVDTLDLAKFVDDAGEIDIDAIAKATALFAVAPSQVDLGQGARGGAPTLDQQLAEAQKNGDVATELNLLNRQLLAQMRANAAP